jgi:hypothetical protein
MNHDDEKDNEWRCLIAAVAASSFYSFNGHDFMVERRNKRHSDAEYGLVVSKVTILKKEKLALLARVFWLSPKAFNKVINIIEAPLMPKKFTSIYVLPPVIKLCLGVYLVARSKLSGT